MATSFNVLLIVIREQPVELTGDVVQADQVTEGHVLLSSFELTGDNVEYMVCGH